MKYKEVKLFMQILYHAYSPMSRFFLASKTEKDGWKESVHFIADELNIPDGVDSYISLGIYRGDSRAASNVLARTALYIDIDCHSCSDDKLLDEVRKKLYDSIDKGIISTPTIIVCTGRGFGIYYILEKPVYISDINVKMVKKLELTYDAIIEIYQGIFDIVDNDGNKIVEVDKCVKDASRVVRLPGTFNSQAGKYAEIEYIHQHNENVIYIQDFKEIAQIGDVKPNVHQAKDMIYSQEDDKFLLKYRMNIIGKLVDMRALNGDRMRENTAFIFYNCAIQVVSQFQAENKLWELNTRFATPLPDSEIRSIISELNGRASYRFSNKKLTELMDITKEEGNQIGFFESKRKREREKAKEEKARQRDERNKKILKRVLENPEISLKSIAEMCGVSLSTVKKLLKSNDIYRYNINPFTKLLSRLGKENSNVITRNYKLAESFFSILIEQIDNVEFYNRYYLRYEDYIKEDNINSKLLINAIAWLADNTRINKESWYFDAYYNIIYIFKGITGTEIELINGKKISLEKLYLYKCRKEVFEIELIKEEPFEEDKHVRAYNKREKINLPYEVVYFYSRMADNMKYMEDYMEELIEDNENYVSLWEWWRKHATKSEYDSVCILYTKLAKSNFSNIRKFLDYAMSACTTNDMQVNIERICKFYRVNNLDDINENVLYKIRIPSIKQRENWQKQGKRKINNNDKNKYLAEHADESILCRELRKLRSKCYKVEDCIGIKGTFYLVDEVKKLLYRLDINDIMELEKLLHNSQLDVKDIEEIHSFILDKSVGLIEKKECSSDWRDKIIKQYPAIYKKQLPCVLVRAD